MEHRVAGVAMPQTELVDAAIVLVRRTLPDIAFNHSMRVYLFAALAAERLGIAFDAELLYVAALFHSLGLTEAHRQSKERFEVDGANAVRQFLRQHGVDERRCETAWDAIALHMTPGIPEHKASEIALLSAGVQMDLQGAAFRAFSSGQRDAVQKAFPRGTGFKQQMLELFANGVRARPETTFGTFAADVLERADPKYRRVNFCGAVLGADWPE
jgi:hypothetical protein